MTTTASQIGTPTYPNYHCCNGICLTIPEDPYSFYAPFTDTWGNAIQFIGRYGTDPRQMYYVYVPTNVNQNSKIVVLIHGGAWITGPDPNQTNGWGSAYTVSGAQQNNNIVRNLLSQGYVVVAPLYRLVSYGDTPTDIAANPVSVTDQINDIDAAITHIHTYFPTCLYGVGPVNANNIQVMGESAGGHLALMFAYTRANTSYIKSVVSVSAPTNLNQYFDFINNKSLIYSGGSWANSIPCNTSSGTDFVIDNYNYVTSTTTYNNKTHFPFFNYYDPNPTGPQLSVTTYINPQNFQCKIANMYLIGYNQNTFATIQNTITAPSAPYIAAWVFPNQNTSKRRLDMYNLAQSIVRQTVSNPLINSVFQNISPCFQLTATRNIPTFILHGTFDELVIYKQATSTMDTRLATNGGVSMYNSSGQNIYGQSAVVGYPVLPSTISFNTGNRHMIKTYTNSGHVLYNPISQNPLVQPDILAWFNNH